MINYILFTILTIGSTCGWVLWFYLLYDNAKDSITDSVYQVSPSQGEDQGNPSQEEVQMQRAIDSYLRREGV